MFCVHCGNTVVDKVDTFCSQCGKLLNSTIPIATTSPRKIPKGWAFWSIATMFGIAWFNLLLFLFYFGHRPPPPVILGVPFWTGCFISYIANKAYGKGWIGFFVGILVGLGALQIVSIISVNIHGVSN